MCEIVHKFTQYTHFLSVTNMTCPDWTIYSWQGFNSLGCPLMLTTNKIFSVINISVDVAKCVVNVHKFTQYSHFCLLLKITCVDWTIYSWQGFNSLGYPLIISTNNRCVLSINISVDVTKCLENVHKFNQFTHFLSVTKNDLSWLNNLFMARFQLIRCPLMLRTKYRCVQSLNISVDDAKCVENVHKFTKYTHFFSVLVLIEQSI